MKQKPILFALAGGLVIAGLCAGVVVWSAARAVRTSSERIESEARIAFTDSVLDTTAPAGFESMAAPSGFHDAAVLNGRLLIGGAGGLFEYDAGGRVLNQFRVGMELPAAPVVAMAIGIAGPSPTPQLWIATAGEGALAYDGSQFRHIRPERAQFRKFTSVLPLATGRILFGAGNAGVLAYDGRSFSTLHPSLAGIQVTALAGDEASLWIGTQDSGVVFWHAGELLRLGEKDGLPDARVFAIAVDGDTAYAATSLGVAEIRDGKVQRTLAQGFTVLSVMKRGDELLAGTLDEGLVRVPLQPRSTIAPKPECPDCRIERILESGAGLLAVTPQGLYRNAGKRTGWSAVLAAGETQLSDRNISAIAPDAQGRLWIGYFDRGLDIATPGEARPRHTEDDVLFCVNRIVHDPERQRVAVATANGLAFYSNGGTLRQVITRADGLIANQVTDVLMRPDGSVIAGTPAGVSFIERSGISSIYAFHGLVNNHVYALGQIGNRTLVGTLGGLSVIESGLAAVRFTTANAGFRHNWITAVLPAANDVFIGTYGGGILHMAADATWQPFADLPPAFEVNPNAMAATQRAVYAGTLDRGLAVYDRAPSRWRWVTRGLPSMNVTSVAAQSGTVYIGTDNGLVRVPEEALLR